MKEYEYTLTLTHEEIEEFINTLVKYKDDENASIRYINEVLWKIENRLKPIKK